MNDDMSNRALLEKIRELEARVIALETLINNPPAADTKRTPRKSMLEGIPE